VSCARAGVPPSQHSAIASPSHKQHRLMFNPSNVNTSAAQSTS
jgi:hypothetical protein